MMLEEEGSLLQEEFAELSELTSPVMFYDLGSFKHATGPQIFQHHLQGVETVLQTLAHRTQFSFSMHLPCGHNQASGGAHLGMPP